MKVFVNMPKMSVNKLGEYMTANSVRRRSIVEDHKKEATFIFGRYSDARSVITDYLVGDISQEDAKKSQDALRKFTAESEFVQSDKRLSAEAIDYFFEILDEIDVTGNLITKGADFENHSVQISGLTVTAKPDLLLRNGETGAVEGCIKFHFSKTVPLNSESGAYVATVMKKYLESEVDEGVKLNSKKCYVVDLPTGSVFEAPTAYKKRMREIEASCEEIILKWEK